MIKSVGTEFKVGLFAILALSALGYMFFVLSPDAFQRREYNSYYTVLDNAAGIVTKSQVKTSGVSIGKVKSVTLDGGQTRVVLEVANTVKIPVGSHIEIRSVGLLGDKHLEIVRPADTGEYIEPNGIIPQSIDSVDMEHLIAMVGDIAKDVKKVTGTLANVFGTKKGEASVQNIVDNVEGLTADLRATTKTVREVVGDRKGELNDIITQVHDGVRDLRAAAKTVKEIASEDNRQKIDHILSQFDETMVDVKGSAKNINLIAEKVEKGEGTIGKLVNDDSTVNELEGAIKDIRKVLAPATKLQVDVDFRDELHRDGSSQGYFNLVFKTRPDRYYLMGLSDEKQETVTTTTSTTADGNATKTVQQIHDQKELSFNLQVAKRWYWAAARIGLFESHVGAATDLYALDDRVKFSLEAFDFDTQDKTVRRTAHIKAYASVLFYNHLYAMAGVDDPTKTDPLTNKARRYFYDPFFGAGMTFTDDDIKALFGAAVLGGEVTTR